MTTEPFDASALLDEIKAGALPFTLGAETFHLPPPQSWSDAILEAAERNEVIQAGRLILGDDDYARFVAAGGSSMLLQTLVEKMYRASLGESWGSSRS